MANFTIRNLEDETHGKLRDLAKRHGESFEAFVRSILRRAVLEQSIEEKPLGTRLSVRFAKCGLKDDETIAEFKGEPLRIAEFD